MIKSKSPGAVAALGASEIDQLGSTVDPRNSPNNLAAQALGGSNAGRCLVCGCAIESRRLGRRRKYCCYPCRDEARRARNFDASGATRRGSSAIPPNSQSNGIASTACKAAVGDRAPIELLGHGYRWHSAMRAEIVAIIQQVIECELGGAAR